MGTHRSPPIPDVAITVTRNRGTIADVTTAEATAGAVQILGAAAAAVGLVVAVDWQRLVRQLVLQLLQLMNWGGEGSALNSAVVSLSNTELMAMRLTLH